MNKNFLIGVAYSIGLTIKISAMDHKNSVDEHMRQFKVAVNKQSNEPMALPTIEDVKAIEKGLGLELHEDHANFLLHYSNQNLTGYDPFRPYKGLESTLAKQIKNAQRLGISSEWIPFCYADNALCCVHSSKGNVAFFERNTDIPTDEYYESLAELVKVLWP